MDLVAQAKRHIDFVLCILQWDYEKVFLSDDVFEDHLLSFSAIFANGLSSPERETVEDYLNTSINSLLQDYQRIGANLLFFGDVKSD